MKQPLLLFSFLLLFLSFAYPQEAPPSNLSGESLRSWLQENWYAGRHTALGYNEARLQMYSSIDKQVDGRVYCVYTGYSQPATSTTYLAPINCEHTVPQSFFSQNEPMKSDIHHLFPTHEEVNAERGNYPFHEIPDEDTDFWYTATADNQYVTSSGIPSAATIDHYSEKDGYVFEPKENHKGDAARAIFYFFTMYPEAAGDISRLVADGNLQLLYEWHLQDPVSDWEQQRNQRVAEVQGNLNPYISYPDIACRAWNLSCTSQNIQLTASLTTFEKTLFGFASQVQSYTVEAQNLTHNLIIQTSADFQLALVNEEGQFTDSLNLEITEGSLPATTIYVRFTPSYAANRLISGSILHYSEEEQTSFAVQGLEGDPNVVEELVYVENFDDCAYAERGWLAISKGSNKDWTCLAYGKDGTNAPEMNGHGGDAPSNDWFVSPEIDLSNVTNPRLSFWARSHYAGGGQQLKVFVSTDFSGDVSAAQWDNLNPELPQAGSRTWAEVALDLKAYAGRKVRIAFQYEAAESYPSWTVDDFQLKELRVPDTYVARFLSADTTLTTGEGEATAFLFLDHKATTPFNLHLLMEETAADSLEVGFLSETDETGPLTLHFAAGDSVKSVQVVVKKTGTLSSPATIVLRTKASAYLQAGTTSTYSITVPADETDGNSGEEEEEEVPTGIREEVAQKIIVFPNPATSLIKLKDLEGNMRYQISSMSGKVLLNGPFKPEEGIRVESLKEGIYLLQIQGPGFLLKKKVSIGR